MALELTEEQKAAGWQVHNIGDLGEIFDGPHATAKKLEHGPYYLSISSLVDGRLILSESAHISEEDYSKWTRRVTPQAGDLLFSYETKLGSVALMPEGIRASLGRRMGLIRFDTEKADNRYMLYKWLSLGFQTYIEQNKISGATVDRIPLTELGKWEVVLPPLAEQKRIAEILGSVDDKIEANSRLIEKLTRLIDLQVEQAHRTASGTLKISDLAVHSKAQILPSKSTDASVLHYSLPAFDLGMVAAEEEAEAILSNKFILSEPAVLFSKLNPGTPRIWMVEPAQEKYSFASTEFVVLQPKEGIGLGTLWAACRDSRVTRRLIELARGTSTSHQRVSPQDILDSEVVLPDIPEAEAELIRQLIVQNNSLVKTRYLLIRHLIG
ncbi:MAG TPA: restriction endonuclease subunit S [Candidatus Rothia avistercoris]|uniref:Restriction endonuclease subunit S n=1 Tax=Candidatus Rothia avistercoris TaxID=2840479 RepID=A0A9D2UFQ2_9MICC|nr:restriction endonuclease subunit S [Candidatus Rothia avistercoris]